MDLDPALLRTLVTVKESGGFTRAARRLHLTQSAVSHQIRRLEEQVGRPLLYRTTRSVTLTEDGEELVRHAEQILAALDALDRRFRRAQISGIVRFGVPDTFLGERLPALMSQFARAFPAVRLDVNVNTYLDLRAMVDANELDLAVVLAMPCGPGETPLRRTQFVWVAAETFDLGQRSSLPLAFAPALCVNRQVGITALEGTALDWHIVFTAQSQQGIRAAVRAGLAIAVLTSGEIEPGMKVVDGQYGLPPLPSADFALIWSAGGKTGAAMALGELLRGAAESPALARPRRAARNA